MNHILIIIGFLLLLCFLSDIKENFSQLILPDFTKAIYTGKYYPTEYTYTSVKDNNRKPSAVEDVEQPPYARFVGGSDKISDSTEDIREIKDSLDRVNDDLNILADSTTNSRYNELNGRSICGDSSQKLLQPNFKTPWRPNGENDLSKKLFERYILQKFSPEDGRCFWNSDQRGNIGCGELNQDCICNYKNNTPINPNPAGQQDWRNHYNDDNKIATADLIEDCTGYNPTGPIDGSTVSEAPYSCKRLCCNNLLFPINNSTNANDRKIYKTYLKSLYNNLVDNPLLDTQVPYIEDYITGVCHYSPPPPGPPAPGPPAPGPPAPSPTPTPPPAPSPTPSVTPKSTDFPSEESSKLHIQVKNSTDQKIRVWMDDLPFCPKIKDIFPVYSLSSPSSQSWTTEMLNQFNNAKYNCGVYQTENPTRIGSEGRYKWGNDWSAFITWAKNNPDLVDDDYIPKFTKITTNENGDFIPEDITSDISDNYYDLEAGEIFKITPPHAMDLVDGTSMYLPQMCFYQVGVPVRDIQNQSQDVYGQKAHITNDGKEYQYNCGGSGLYFTIAPENPHKYDYTLLGPDAISRIEYNINGDGSLYFNLSGVDGLNARYSMEVINDLCEGEGEGGMITSKCNIDIDQCSLNTIYSKSMDREDINKLNNNYLEFANKDPNTKSCPSPKFYYTYDTVIHNSNNVYDYKTQGLIGRGNITYDNLISGNPKIDHCENVITNASWDEYIEKTVIFTDDPLDQNIATHNIGDIRMADLSSRSGIDINTLVKHAYFLKPTNASSNFGVGNFYGDIDLKDSTGKKTFTNITLAECPWGSEREKALCHLWWGAENNNCGNDWKKYLYESNEYKSNNWDNTVCNQYSWAYGEMGYDYTQRRNDGTPKNKVSELEWSELLTQGNIMDNTISGKIKENGFLVIYKGNPQKTFPLGGWDSANHKWVWANDKGSNLESFNKPLLNCPMANKVKPEYLKSKPIYININIMEVMKGKYELSDQQKSICTDASGNKCNSWFEIKDCIDESSCNRPPPFPTIPWNKPMCINASGDGPCEGFYNDHPIANGNYFIINYDDAVNKCNNNYNSCKVQEGVKDLYCHVGGDAQCSASNELQCFKDGLNKDLNYPFYCSNLLPTPTPSLSPHQ